MALRYVDIAYDVLIPDIKVVLQIIFSNSGSSDERVSLLNFRKLRASYVVRDLEGYVGPHKGVPL